MFPKETNVYKATSKYSSYDNLIFNNTKNVNDIVNRRVNSFKLRDKYWNAEGIYFAYLPTELNTEISNITKLHNIVNIRLSRQYDLRS